VISVGVANMNGSSKGFSLIELMVIIVILATLSTISLPIYQNYMSTSAATTYVGEFSEFKHAYENEALIARREICDADYLSQLKVESEPISALFRSRLSIDKQDGILVEVTAALDQESLAGLEAARLVHQNFQSKGAVVGSPMVTDSFVHFQAALVDCNAQSQSGSGSGSGSGSTGPASGGGGSSGNGSVANKPAQPPALNCGPTEIEFQGRCVQPATCPGGSPSPSDPTQCQQCGSGFDLIGGACLAECASGEARDASNRCVTVADCKAGPQVAGQPDQCQSCGMGFSLDGGQCVCDFSTHGLLGGLCIQKADCFGGNVSSTNPMQCQTCGPGYDLVGTECKPACGAGESRSAAGQCVTIADCKGGAQISGQPDQCQRCGNGFSSDGGQCVCDPSTHGLLGGQCVQKANCFGGSVKPGNPTHCQTCGQGHDLVGNECKPACGAGELRSAAGQCVTIADCKGGTPVSGQPDQCQSCGMGFSLDGGQCVCDFSTHGLLGGQCVQQANCYGGSVKPGNPTQCQSCGPGHDLVGNQCLPACGQGQARNLNSQCVVAADCHGGQYNPSNPSQCQSCGPGTVKVGVQCVTKANDCSQAKNACSGISRANKFWQCVGGKLHHGNQGGWKAVQRFCS